MGSASLCWRSSWITTAMMDVSLAFLARRITSSSPKNDVRESAELRRRTTCSCSTSETVANGSSAVLEWWPLGSAESHPTIPTGTSLAGPSRTSTATASCCRTRSGVRSTTWHCRTWLAGLRDPRVASALATMHADPGAAWTVDRLARETNQSRASLTRHFTALVGEPPLAYLTRWRMELAARQLRETNDVVSAIARRVGYTSEFAFSRAFPRARGRPPGRYRTEQQSK